MKVFLSWSGPTSHKVACAFREWLPSVIQSIVPYVSSEDIDKGARWSTDIAKELEDSRYGVICVTKENITAPWINFEAGALSKIIEKSFVTPFLFDLKRSDVQGPLLQFQSTVLEKDDVLKLLKSINGRGLEAERLKDEAIRKAFEVWWPHIETTLKTIKASEDEQSKPVAKPKEKIPEILEEILELTRAQTRLLGNPSDILPADYLAYALERAGAKEGLRTYDREMLHRIHQSLLELEEFLHGHKKEHPYITEAIELAGRVHSFFHTLQGWPDADPVSDKRRILVRRRQAKPDIA